MTDPPVFTGPQGAHIVGQQADSTDMAAEQAAAAQAAAAPPEAVNPAKPWLADKAVGDVQTPSAAEEPWKQDQAVGGTAMDKVTAAGQGFTGGFVENAPIIPGMIAGAELGTLGGPFAPITVPAGAAAGAAAGYFFGKSARDLLSRLKYPNSIPVTTPSVESMPEELRPYGYLGETFGGSIPFAAAPLAAARTGFQFGASRVGGFLNRIIDFAAANPLSFTGSEMAGAGGAAAASFAAESFRPGDQGTRAAAEIAGGFFSPTRLVMGTVKGATGSVRLAVSAMSEAGRTTQSAKILQEAMRLGGEDPAAVAMLLRQSGLPGINMTMAQKTGSPALAAVEAKLASESGRFGAEQKKMAEDSLKGIADMITALRGTGDPQALATAADLQQRYFRMILAGRLQEAERQAAEAAAAITADTPATRAQLSTRASELLDGALRDARTIESELWSQVPTDIPIKLTNRQGGLFATYDDIRAGLLPREPMPAVVEGTIQDLREAKTTTLGELQRLRSRMLALARAAAGQGNANDARIYGNLAEGALNSMNSAFTPGQIGGVMRTLGARQEAYDAARGFSRELNDTFTRSFAGNALATTATGADRIPPELMLRRALATGQEAGALRFGEIRDALGFVMRNGGPEAAQNFDEMLNLQERMIRLAANEAVDPATGRVSVTRLSRIIQNNEALLDQFPAVRRDLDLAVRGQQRLADLQSVVDAGSRIADQRAAFAKVAKFENPVDAINSVLRGRAPVADFNRIVAVARKGGPDALAGLRSTIFDHAFEKATDQAGEISFTRLRNALTSPIGSGQPSLVDLMVRQKVISPPEAANLGKLFDEAQRIEGALTSGKDLEALIRAPDALFDLIVRSAGAGMASKLAQYTTGRTLIAQSAGSQYARRLFEKLPQARVKDILIKAALDPQFAADLLEKPTSASQGLQVARQIHAYLVQAGLTATTPEGPAPQPQSPEGQ